MQIGYFLFIFLVVSIALALRLKNKITRIFSIAAISAFFLAMMIVSVLPTSEVTDGRTVFITSLVFAGIIFTIIVLINIITGMIGKKKIAENIEQEGK